MRSPLPFPQVLQGPDFIRATKIILQYILLQYASSGYAHSQTHKLALTRHRDGIAARHRQRALAVRGRRRGAGERPLEGAAVHVGEAAHLNHTSPPGARQGRARGIDVCALPLLQAPAPLPGVGIAAGIVHSAAPTAQAILELSVVPGHEQRIRGSWRLHEKTLSQSCSPGRVGIGHFSDPRLDPALEKAFVDCTWRSRLSPLGIGRTTTVRVFALMVPVALEEPSLVSVAVGVGRAAQLRSQGLVRAKLHWRRIYPVPDTSAESSVDRAPSNVSSRDFVVTDGSPSSPSAAASAPSTSTDMLTTAPSSRGPLYE